MNILVDQNTGFCIGIGDAWHGYPNAYPKPSFITLNDFDLWQWDMVGDIQQQNSWTKTPAPIFIEPIEVDIP